jgi:hypothetical protein
MPTQAEWVNSGGATDAELAGEVAARIAADVLEQDAATAATDAELAPVAADVAILKEAPVNPLHPEYGATGDGVADDTAELQAALAAAAGGELILPGSFFITDDLEPAANTTIRGVGRSQIKVGGAAHTAGSLNGITAANKVGIRLLDFTLTGPEDGTVVGANGADAGRGVFFDGVDDFLIRGLLVERFNIQGIYMGACERGRVTENEVLDIYSGNGISVDGLSLDVIVAANNLKHIADCALGAHNGALRTIFAHNTIADTNFGRGIDIYGAPETLALANTMRDVGGVGGAGFGIYLAIGLGATQPHRCALIGNAIVAADDSGILIDGGATGIQQTLLASNQVLNSGDKGVYLAGKVLGLVLTGGEISGSAGAGVYAEESGANIPTGIRIGGGVKITNNGTFGVHATANVADLKISDVDLAGNAVQAVNVPIPSVVAAAALALPTHSGIVTVTGNTNINSLAIGAIGERVTLRFTGTPTVSGAANIKLAGGTFAASASDTLTLVSDGSATWHEEGRAVVP